MEMVLYIVGSLALALGWVLIAGLERQLKRQGQELSQARAAAVQHAEQARTAEFARATWERQYQSAVQRGGLCDILLAEVGTEYTWPPKDGVVHVVRGDGSRATVTLTVLGEEKGDALERAMEQAPGSMDLAEWLRRYRKAPTEIYDYEAPRVTISPGEIDFDEILRQARNN